ncbi:hypothetical protein NSP_42770 [Nodularia spumigena CCY9414]|nr:hypothetical protein NSP_42770 [Nodularia spumigena CCY9414]
MSWRFRNLRLIKFDIPHIPQYLDVALLTNHKAYTDLIY